MAAMFAASCNLPDLPFLSDETSVAEPDGTRGDTTFYHYTVRYPDTTKVETFATFDGVWNWYWLEGGRRHRLLHNLLAQSDQHSEPDMRG